MSKPWHYFQLGQQYPLGAVVTACERRIAEGGVIRAERKQQLLDLLREYAPPTVVWSPFSTGWGASPFNPNCWRTAEGGPVLPEGVEVPEFPEVDA